MIVYDKNLKKYKLNSISFYFRMASSNNNETTTNTIEVIAQEVQAQSNLIFLQTTAAQVIAGLFVWTAVFVTCQQVKYLKLK